MTCLGECGFVQRVEVDLATKVARTIEEPDIKKAADKEMSDSSPRRVRVPLEELQPSFAHPKQVRCLVTGCKRTLFDGGDGMCKPHRGLWLFDGKPPVVEWAAAHAKKPKAVDTAAGPGKRGRPRKVKAEPPPVVTPPPMLRLPARPQPPQRLTELPAPVTMRATDPPELDGEIQMDGLNKQETPMARCEIKGCGEDVKISGLCGKHYQRYAKCGRPELQAWIAAGGPGLRDMKKAGAAGEPSISPPIASARPRGARPPVPAAPVPVTSEDAAGAVHFITFDEPVAAIGVGVMGKYLTIQDVDGLVLKQIPLPRAS